jgi:shikimate kinase
MDAERNIVLVGFMGTGKTAVGRRLAERLGRELLDMDATLEARAGKPITQIFAEDGEPHFRALERALVRELAARSGLVISTGGGIVLNPDNVADFERTGLVVCLTAAPEVILRRVAHETHRPLLRAADKRERITALLAQRAPLYAAVTHQVDTDSLTADAAADRILALYRSCSPR